MHFLFATENIIYFIHKRKIHLLGNLFPLHILHCSHQHHSTSILAISMNFQYRYIYYTPLPLLSFPLKVSRGPFVSKPVTSSPFLLLGSPPLLPTPLPPLSSPPSPPSHILIILVSSCIPIIHPYSYYLGTVYTKSHFLYSYYTVT